MVTSWPMVASSPPNWRAFYAAVHGAAVTLLISCCDEGAVVAGTDSESNRTIVIDPRFAAFELGGNGFAVGGYTCGVVTEGWNSATVRLRRPTPVGIPLVLQDSGERRALLSDGDAVATAETHEPITGPSSLVSFADATVAARSYPGLTPHNPAPRCFVCGPEREKGDGLRIFAGPVGNGLFASPWEPDPSLADDDGRVAPEFLWSALECPGAPVFWEPGTAPLATRTTATLTGKPAPGDRCVVVAASLGTTEHGHRTATWLLGPDAEILGRAEVEWIAIPLSQG